MFVPGMKKAALLLTAVTLATLAACGGGGGGGPAQAVVAGVTSPQVLEANAGTSLLSFVVTLDKPAVSAMSINYTLASTAKAGGGSTGSAVGGAACGAGVDYINPGASQLAIAAGASTGRIDVTVCGDALFEPTETLALRWSNAGTGTAIGTIVNDDAGGLNGPGVAGSFGRDSNPLTNASTDGRLGFSFALLPSATDPRCTRDNVTGLLWENKAAGGLHDPTTTYSYADLAAFVAAVNTEALCGFSDWHVPTPEELSSIVDSAVTTTPTLDTAWFPNTQAGRYWTGTTYRGPIGQDAWFVDFASGTVAIDNQTKLFHARLVTRGGTTASAAAPASCTDSSRFVDHGDGTVSDASTGLMWKKCAEGFNATACTGTGAALNWDLALARPATVNADSAGAGLGYSDWRLPTRAELSSITAREQCFNPALNTATFANGEALGFWTATPFALNAAYAWAVEFYDGQVAPAAKSTVNADKRVRLVRLGQ